VKGVVGTWMFLAQRQYLSHFFSNYDLIEYPLAKHHYTWFRGRSMSRIDRDFAPSSSSILQYPSLTLTTYIS
jgi:hypothetical protein